MMRSQLAWSAYLLVAMSAIAYAQPNVDCRKTETQAECHARLQCKANEELQDCQKRLLKCKADEDLDTCKKRSSSGGQRGGGGDGRGGDGRGGDGRGGDGRGGDGRGGDDRDDRGDDDRGGDDRGGDRGGDERGGNDRASDRGGSDRGQRRGGRGGRGRGRRGGRGFETIKTFGLGVELGEPTGLNGKYFVSDSGAIDFGVGWIYRHYYYGDGIHLYGDYLFHPVSLVSSPTLELPFYVGIGLRYWDFDYCINNVCDFGGSALGIRVPLGISFDFNNAPIDIFLQIVPTLDFVRGDYYDRYDDRTHFGFDGSVGFRYWFK